MFILTQIKGKVRKWFREGLEIVVQSVENPQKKVTIFLPGVSQSDLGTSEPGDFDIFDHEPYTKFSDYEYYKGKGDDGRDYWIKVDRGRTARERARARRREAEKRALERRLVELEKAGRFEEAAEVCEKLGMFEKAGKLRRKAKELTIVYLDLNNLIKNLSEKGLTLTYRCSNCGAPLKITPETKAEGMRFCPYCGSQIEIIDLAKFIKSYLS